MTCNDIMPKSIRTHIPMACPVPTIMSMMRVKSVASPGPTVPSTENEVTARSLSSEKMTNGYKYIHCHGNADQNVQLRRIMLDNGVSRQIYSLWWVKVLLKSRHSYLHGTIYMQVISKYKYKYFSLESWLIIDSKDTPTLVTTLEIFYSSKTDHK